MKYFLLITALFGINITSAETYYFSSVSGQDSYTNSEAQSQSTPWKSLEKLNNIISTLSSGDSILLKRGETFYGSITITKQATGVESIILGAYGEGAKPIITGFTSVNTWTETGVNIWESANAVSVLPYTNLLSINGVNTAMGRFPNTGYLTLLSHTGKTVIEANDLPSSVMNWTGADIVIKKNRWTLEKGNITSHSGTTVTFNGENAYTPNDGFGFFI